MGGGGGSGSGLWPCSQHAEDEWGGQAVLGAEGQKPQGRKGYKGGGPWVRHPLEGMALLLLGLGLSLVSAQEFNPRAVVRKNYDMAKVGLGSGVWAFPPSGVFDLGGHGSWKGLLLLPEL